MSAQPTPHASLTAHEKRIVAVLAFLQFTVMVDFMILGPLGAHLIRDLAIDTAQFGLTVSAYALSAGVSSFASAAYADRFDRRKLLLLLYAGFVAGTACCGLAPTYELLLGARVFTGVFGGVLGSISMAIVADVFPLAIRGRVMGTMMTAYSAAQIAGVPAGLLLSNMWGWHAPFLVLAGLGALVGVGVASVLGPLDAHLRAPPLAQPAAAPRPLAHMLHTATRPAHLRAFGCTVLLASGFMLMPLFSPFFVHNLHVELERLPLIFMITGGVTFVAGPLVGRLADRVGKLRLFAAGSVLCAITYVVWARVPPVAWWWVVVVYGVMFVANTARMIAAGALTSAVPAPADRGAFMSFNTSLQQLTGGAASALGGAIVVVQPDGALARFDTLCFIVAGLVLLALVPMWRIDRQLTMKTS